MVDARQGGSTGAARSAESAKADMDEAARRMMRLSAVPKKGDLELQRELGRTREASRHLVSHPHTHHHPHPQCPPVHLSV